MRQTTATARQAYLFDNLDVPEIIDFLAAKIITADTDCCHKNYYLYRDSDGTGEWQAMPWDVDLSFRPGLDLRLALPGLLRRDDLHQPAHHRRGRQHGLHPDLRHARHPPDVPAPPAHADGPIVPAARHARHQRFLPPQDAGVCATRSPPDAALDLAKWGTWGTRETITQAVNRDLERVPARRAGLSFVPTRPKSPPRSRPTRPSKSTAWNSGRPAATRSRSGSRSPTPTPTRWISPGGA